MPGFVVVSAVCVAGNWRLPSCSSLAAASCQGGLPYIPNSASSADACNGVKAGETCLDFKCQSGFEPSRPILCNAYTLRFESTTCIPMRCNKVYSTPYGSTGLSCAAGAPICPFKCLHSSSVKSSDVACINGHYRSAWCEDRPSPMSVSVIADIVTASSSNVFEPWSIGRGMRLGSGSLFGFVGIGIFHSGTTSVLVASLEKVSQEPRELEGINSEIMK